MFATRKSAAKTASATHTYEITAIVASDAETLAWAMRTGAWRHGLAQAHKHVATVKAHSVDAAHVKAAAWLDTQGVAYEFVAEDARPA